MYSANTQYTMHTRRANTPTGLEDNRMFMMVMTGYQRENSVKVSMFNFKTKKDVKVSSDNLL